MHKEKTGTLTNIRAGQGGPSRNTRMSTSEMFRLQGFPVDRFAQPPSKPKVTLRQLHCMIGNAMTLSMLYRITRNLLIAANKIDGRRVKDEIEDLGRIPWF